MHVSKKSWFKKIRSTSWLSFRYYWLIWVGFIALTALLSYYYQFTKDSKTCKTNSLETINEINRSLDNCCECGTDTTGIHFPADYLIITHQFDAEGGRDLDTKTVISSPLSAGPLGYCDLSNHGDPYLFWSGDNTGTGVESCLIDLIRFGTNDVVTIDCSALWWSRRNSGDMSLDIRAYEGGTMSLNGYQFVNSGGTESAFTSFNGNVLNVGPDCNKMEPVGTIVYNKKNKTLQFIPAQNNQ
jgi:hypothetical protein